MPQFVLLCRDKPDSLALRMETRPAHLAYFHGFGNKAVFGGPMLSETDEPIGSMLVIEAENAAAAREIAANDPYAKAGLFSEVTITPFKTVIANFQED